MKWLEPRPFFRETEEELEARHLRYELEVEEPQPWEKEWQERYDDPEQFNAGA